MSVPDDLITLEEAKQLSGLSREGLYYHARKGTIKIYRRAGKRVSFVSKKEIEDLISFKEVELSNKKQASTQHNIQ